MTTQANVQRRRPGEFDYVNRHYGLKLQRGAAVLQTSTGRRGTVASANGHYINIRWDGCPHVERPEGCGCGQARAAFGPFHPTDNLTYPEAP